MFNGLTSSGSVSNCIEYIDLGAIDAVSISQAKWVNVPVKDQDFITNDPRGSAYNPSNNEILIFGGSRN